MSALIVSLLSGAVGGNLIGKFMPSLDQGTLVNSISGIAGGGLGSTIIGAVLGGGAAASGGMDVGSIISAVAGGGVGGGVVLWLVGMVKGMLGK